MLKTICSITAKFVIYCKRLLFCLPQLQIFFKGCQPSPAPLHYLSAEVVSTLSVTRLFSFTAVDLMGCKSQAHNQQTKRTWSCWGTFLACREMGRYILSVFKIFLEDRWFDSHCSARQSVLGKILNRKLPLPPVYGCTDVQTLELHSEYSVCLNDWSRPVKPWHSRLNWKDYIFTFNTRASTSGASGSYSEALVFQELFRRKSSSTGFCHNSPEMLCGLRNFPSAWGREDNDQVFNFRQTYPLMLYLSWDCYSPRGGCNNATIIKNVYLTDRHRCLWGNRRNSLYPRPMKKTLRWLSKQTTTLGGFRVLLLLR